MTTQFSHYVSTKVLIEQARSSSNQLKAPSMREGRDGVAAEGLKVETFQADLDQAIEDGQNAEATQERLKQKYLHEAHQDQALAQQGYRWVQRLQSKSRFAEASMAENLELPSRLRFGKLRSARARGVIYHLRIILPELETLRAQLAPFGIDEAFIAQGYKILADLGVERAETAEAKAEREDMTRQVRKAEKRLDQLLTQLDAADQAAALARPDARRFFSLEIIKAEMARQNAETTLREAPLPSEVVSSPIDND